MAMDRAYIDYEKFGHHACIVTYVDEEKRKLIFLLSNDTDLDLLTVMQHDGHYDLNLTTRYANHADPHLVEPIKERTPRF
ncbi:MAG: hypothetical protein MJZ90_05115 [Bacteroidales bacterium]|nr:hypothetical protein [Bacteroidales bacterium]